MGVIVNDTISLKIGISKQQCYINIGYEPIILNKTKNRSNGESEYIVSVTFAIYYDIESYTQGGDSIDKKKLSITVNSSDINTNLYILLYDRLKLEYSSFINV